MFYSFVTKHACDGKTDGRRDRITIPKTALAYLLCMVIKSMYSKYTTVVSIM